MGQRAPLTPEMVEMLRAVERGEIVRFPSGRWRYPDGRPVPARPRRLLTARGYIRSSFFAGPVSMRLTRLGAETLASASPGEAK